MDLEPHLSRLQSISVLEKSSAVMEEEEEEGEFRAVLGVCLKMFDSRAEGTKTLHTAAAVALFVP